MAIDCILAMTAAEIRANSPFQQKIAWLSCHFSSCSTGISNLPEGLPPGSLLILDDSIPYDGHDNGRIAAELEEVLIMQNCEGLLLDFQREWNEGIMTLAKALSQGLPCPVAVSECYAADANGPVFLPPVPPDIPLRDYLKPWEGREIWLDISPGGTELRLTPGGCTAAPLPVHEIPAGILHADTALLCHYTIHTEADCVAFRLLRTGEDLENLAVQAKALGVTKCVGLWQELAMPDSEGHDLIHGQRS